MTTPPVAAIKIHLLFQNIKFSWNPNPKPFNKFDIETQAFFEDTVFPYKRPSQSSLDCSKPSTMTTTPKSDSSSNHPELHHLLHRSPHDNRSLRDDRLHHQLHLLNLTVNDITPSTSPSSLITISRSQSRITSSTLSTWKNTYSNFNMVTLYLINMKTIISKTFPPGKTIELVLLRRSFLDYQQA